MRGDRADNRGSASLLVVSLTGVLVLLGLASTVMTAAAAAHRQAQSAADLAALAGATTVQRGGDACAAASGIAVKNRASLVGCAVEGQDIAVSVRVEGPQFLGHTFEITGHSRAGPHVGPQTR